MIDKIVPNGVRAKEVRQRVAVALVTSPEQVAERFDRFQGVISVTGGAQLIVFSVTALTHDGRAAWSLAATYIAGNALSL